jgi:hypothetical protein
VLARVASDYSKTLLARCGGWLPPFFSSVFLVFYSFGGGFAYARGLEFPTRIGVCWWRFSFLFCFSLSGVGLLEKVFYFASIEKLGMCPCVATDNKKSIEKINIYASI